MGVNHSFSSLWGRSIIDAHWVRQAEAIQRELYITGLNRSWVFRNGADSRIAGAGWCYVDRFYDVIGAATLLLDGVSRRAYHAYYRPTLFFPTELKQPTTPPKKKKNQKSGRRLPSTPVNDTTADLRKCKSVSRAGLLLVRRLPTFQYSLYGASEF